MEGVTQIRSAASLVFISLLKFLEDSWTLIICLFLKKNKEKDNMSVVSSEDEFV